MEKTKVVVKEEQLSEGTRLSGSDTLKWWHVSQDLEMLNELAKRIWWMQLLQAWGQYRAPRWEHTQSCWGAVAGPVFSWRKLGRPRVVGDDISEATEDQICKGRGVSGRLWMLLQNGSHWQALRVEGTCCDLMPGWLRLACWKENCSCNHRCCHDYVSVHQLKKQLHCRAYWEIFRANTCSPLKDKMYLQGTLGAFLSSGTYKEMGSRDLQILDVLTLVDIGKLLLRRDLFHASKISARNTHCPGKYSLLNQQPQWELVGALNGFWFQPDNSILTW